MISSNLFGGSRNDIGPYRATRLWNDLVRTFRAGMPVGRKRRQLKIYEDAFVASDAVAWLHEYLQQNLDSGPEITRPQTVLLLQKFQRSAVIQDVRGDKSNAEPLEDNGRLFRFTRLSPRKLAAAATRVPFASRTNLVTSGTSEAGLQQQQMLSDAKRALCSSTAAVNCPSVAAVAPGFAGARRWQSEDTVFAKARPEKQQQPHSCTRSVPPTTAVAAAVQQTFLADGSRPLSGGGSSSNQADRSVWKVLALEHLRKTLLLRSCDELPVDSGLIKAADIIQNVQQYQQQLQTSGGATCLQGSKSSPANDSSLPGWLAIAMRCLARWPQRADDDLPQYPGYEKDVYAMVKDYFESQPEPMVPFRFYHIITYAWAQTLVAGRSSSGQSAAAPLAATPCCEPPPPLPPRRLAAASSSSTVCEDGDVNAVPLPPDTVSAAAAAAPKLLLLPAAADSCALFAKLECGPVLQLPRSAAEEESDELNGSLYYTPPTAPPAMPLAARRVGPAADRCGREGACSSSAAAAAIGGRSPLDFYARQCIARLDVESRGCKTDGAALIHASKRFRPMLSHGGSMPNLVAFDSVPAAGGVSSRLSVAGSSAPTDGGYGSAESVCSTVPAPRGSGRVAHEGGQGSVAGTLKKFASVRDLGTTVQSNLAPAQQRFFSASDVTGAEAFLQSSMPNSRPGDPEAADAAAATSARPAVQPVVCRKSTGLLSEQQEWWEPGGGHVGRGHDRHGSAGSAAGQATPLGYQPVLSAAALRATKRPVAVIAQRFADDGAAGSACSAAAAAAPAAVGAAVGGFTLSRCTGAGAPAAACDVQVSSAVRAEPQASGALSETMRSRLMRSLQLCLLLLPPTSRRHLQILLRLLHRLSHNSSLRLTGGAAGAPAAAATAAGQTLPHQSAKEFVLHSFWRSILRCLNEADMDELVAMRIVSFLLDNHEHVMAVPADLLKSIQCLQADTAPRSGEQRPVRCGTLTTGTTTNLQQQRQQPKLVDPAVERPPSGTVVRRVLSEPLRNSVKPRPMTYCEQVTKETYEEQRMSVSERALTELLDNLLVDTKMAEKEKKKKLKQFQKAYPEIYVARFPTVESQPAYMKEQPKIKQPLLSRPLRLLRNLR